MVLILDGPLQGTALFRGRMATAEICAEVAERVNASPKTDKSNRYFCTEERH